jgi:hypothetical protein
MIQEIMEMMKLLDHQHKNNTGVDGERTDRRPSLEELLAYLHQANSASSGAGGDSALPRGVGSGLSANFEEIIAQHIALNGNARQQAALQQQQAKRKQAKRATNGGNGTTTTQAVRNAVKNFTYPDELVQEVFTDDERTVALFRSFVPQDGVSVEFHRLDDEVPAKGSKKSKKANAGESKKSAAPPVAVAASGSARATDAEDAGSAALCFGADDDDLVDADDDVMVHEEDLQQINHMIQALDPLTQETLEELSSEWEVSFPNGGEHLLYRTNITERIRFLAATMVVGVADRFQVLQNNHTNTDDAERERMVLVNNLVLSLWHGINVLTENVRKNFAVIFGLEADSTAHDVCVAVAGLGIAAFFEPLPLHLIERVCHELDLPPVDSKVDPDLLHEALSHRICAHFYPALGRLPDMNLRCTTQLTVHENGPGSYTCTIDNALLMDLIMRQVHTSNRFACRKVKWRARVEVQNGELCFAVMHRDPKPYNVTMVVRTSEKGKKKKANDDGTVSQNSVGGLYLEKQDVAVSGVPVGFRNIVPVQHVYRHVTTAPNGLRLYNRAEDRVIFQFSMEISSCDDGGRLADDVVKHAAPAAVAAAPAAQSKGKGASAGSNTVDPNNAGQTIAELIEQEEREKREKLAAKHRQKNDKRTKLLEQTESQARDQLLSQQSTSHSQMMADCTKSFQKAVQKKKDRERKQELAKATPSSELNAQLTALEQAVRQARSAFSKLAQEKAKEDKEIASLTQQLESRNEELEALQSATEENELTLQQLQEELEAAEDRVAEKSKALEAKKERQQRRKKSSSTNQSSLTSGLTYGGGAAADDTSGNQATLSIKDFQSFWNISSTSVPSSSGAAPGGSAPGAAIGMSSSAFGTSTMPSNPGAAAVMNMGLDFGAFSASMAAPSGMGHHRGNPAFSLNGDAPPFYGSSYDNRPTAMMSSNVPQRSPMPGGYGVTSMPPSSGVGGYAPPGGFSPYGMGRMQSTGGPPGPMNMSGNMGGPMGGGPMGSGPMGGQMGGAPMGGGPSNGRGPQQQQQQQQQQQVNFPPHLARNPGPNFRGGYGGGYGEGF